ncbi:zinc-ribbon domain-containing protein [bacterium]|nr:zinc-ribbon domain-containing protein [bacterium]MDY3023038.1 zinc-ribbon domain-containing protein [Oliverpabstia sp.]
MKCWNCNEELEDDSLYCTSCGKMQNLSREKPSKPSENNEDKGKKCPYCEKILDDNAKYCIFCGKKLSAPINFKQPVYKYLSGIAVLVLVLLVVLGSVLISKPTQTKETQPSVNIDKKTNLWEVDNREADSEEISDQDSNADSENEVEMLSYEGALDAVHQGNIVVTGSIESGNILLLEEKTDICALDENRVPARLNQVYYMQIIDETGDDFDFENEVGAKVEMTGTIEFSNGTPVIFVEKIDVLEEAVQEDAIHRYEVIIEDCTWEEAYQNCLSMGGYLARINSKEEFDYITKKVVEKEKNYSKKQYYVGIRRDVNSDAYYLVDENNELMGDRLDNGYTSWANSLWLSKEPSYYDSTLKIEETCVSIFKYKETNKWVMNDIPSNLVIQVPSYEGKLGYICEFDK